MNLTITNIIQKKEMVDLVSYFLHDTGCSKITFDNNKKSFKCEIVRYYFEGRKQVRTLFSLATNIICPTITTELIIGPIEEYSISDNPNLAELSALSTQFVFLVLEKEKLTITFSSGEIELRLFPDSSLSLNDISSPTDKYESTFFCSRLKHFDKFDRLTQNATL